MCLLLEKANMRVVMYPWPVYGGPLGLNFANLDNGKMLMTSTQVFRIEPL